MTTAVATECTRPLICSLMISKHKVFFLGGGVLSQRVESVKTEKKHSVSRATHSGGTCAELWIFKEQLLCSKYSISLQMEVIKLMCAYLN